MSRDVKYIGMDTHKEAIVIAVRNASGKLVMESIVETKATSLLQFIHGLRGELHVTNQCSFSKESSMVLWVTCFRPVPLGFMLSRVGAVLGD